MPSINPLRLFALLSSVLGASLLSQTNAQESTFYPSGKTKWESASAKQAKLSPANVEAAVQYAFQNNTSSLIILFDGRIVAEKHLEMGTPEMDALKLGRMQIGASEHNHSIEDVASVQKSVASVLLGIAIERKLIKLTDSVSRHLGEGWSMTTKEQEGRIQVKHLVTMTTGLNRRLAYSKPPGDAWQYNTTAYALVPKLVEVASGKSLNEVSRNWLFDKVGMKDSRWIKRSRLIQGTSGNSKGLATTARDLAKFGILVSSGGKWQDSRVYSNEGYFSKMTQSSQKLNPAYGYLWWLNGQDSFLSPSGIRRRGSRMPNAPSDLFDAAGALGRRLFIVPSQKLVIVRLGSRPNDRQFSNSFWEKLKGDK